MSVRRALLSVSDKAGLVDFARELSGLGIELLSTGGTHRALTDAGLTVRAVSDVTGFPEIMDGRVKTLHPAIHGGLLGRRGTDDAVMAEHGIGRIDLLVVNLYPFQATVAKPGCTREEGIENIDIGGPAMVRAAAKNHAHVGVVTDPADYGPVLEALRATRALPQALRESLATKAFAHTARYDAAVAAWLSTDKSSPFPGVLGVQARRRTVLRYGENPHQRAAFYALDDAPPGSIAAATLRQGKALSYNNIADADAALECVKQFDAPACVIVKHANPCGVAVSEDGPLAAYERAHATDPTSAFGGIIAFNRPLDGATATAVLAKQFVEVLIAPEVSGEAAAAAQSKPNVRLLETGAWPDEAPATWTLKQVGGGLLLQDADVAVTSARDLKVVSKRAPDEAQLRDLVFAAQVASFVKSNAIVYVKDGATVGIGAGQMSRVDSARIAVLKAKDAGLSVEGAVMASDAFFPFRDGIDAAAQAGVKAVIQPGGSKRDDEVIAAADEHGLAMVFSGVRHFRH